MPFKVQTVIKTIWLILARFPEAGNALHNTNRQAIVLIENVHWQTNTVIGLWTDLLKKDKIQKTLLNPGIYID